MEFEALIASWQQLGATDPRWAILSKAGREGGRWDDSSFWHSGVDAIGWIARHLDGIGALPRLDRALDFGCGIGRLSQALAHHFAAVVGVDVAQSMLAGANAANRHGDRVRYVHNTHPDLRVFEDASFDFVLTLIVLQHMRPAYAAGYLREFLRILRPGGVLFFQIPIEPLLPAAPADPAPMAATPSPSPQPPFAVRAFTAALPQLRDLAENEWQWFRVEVCNPGPHHFHARGAGAIEIASRFDRLDGTAATPIRWTPLPHDLPPGARATIVFAERAPATTGHYVFQALPAVGRNWFAHAGNVPATCRTTVGPSPPGHVQPDHPPPPPIVAAPDGSSLIEVYGTSLKDLHATITAAGGEFVDAAIDSWAGYEWVSGHFVVRKK